MSKKDNRIPGEAVGSKLIQVIDICEGSRTRKVTIVQILNKEICPVMGINHTLLSGVSICSTEDEFDEVRGEQIATGKAVNIKSTLHDWIMMYGPRIRMNIRRLHFDNLVADVRDRPHKYFLYGDRVKDDERAKKAYERAKE